MTLYGDDSFVCPNCGQCAIGNDNLLEGNQFGEPIFECDECDWQGENPSDWEFYSPYDTREEERGLK